MEHLRWIILALGLLVVILIFLFGRKKANKRPSAGSPETLKDDDLPSMSASEFWGDDNSEPDSDVLITTDMNQFELNQKLVEEVSASVDDVLPDVMTSGSVLKTQNKKVAEETPGEPVEETEAKLADEPAADGYPNDLIILHIKTRSGYVNGSDLLKAINQQQLKFGDMNIYHAYDDANDIIFSMSNMVEPGYFEPEKIADMTTSGVILFMQLSLVNDTVPAFERMIQCASTLATALNADLMTAEQQLLTADMIESFKTKAAYFK